MAQLLKDDYKRKVLEESIKALAHSNPAQAEKLFNVTLKQIKGVEIDYKELVSYPSAQKSSQDKSYYSPKEAANKLGLSDQTIRRMCENGKFPRAYQTSGGHWRIPQDLFSTTEDQDRAAALFFKTVDRKNKKAGNIDEFNL